MKSELDEIVKQSLIKALEYDENGNAGQAYAHYTAVLELCPSKRPELEKSFTRVLCDWGLQLESVNRIKDVVKVYENSLHIYPNSPVILNNFAAHLLRDEEPTLAIQYLRKALKVNKNYLPAERNLQNSYSMCVDRWHYLMLNDKKRNQAFELAIRKKVALGYDTVLDIGTGTGLLSLYAKNAGAKELYACESSDVMADIAKEVFDHNQASDIKLINKASTDLKIPLDLPERVKLIVTEIFDAALFGEFVIPTMIDAHNKLLTTNGSGTIIPLKASLFIAAVECEYIRFRSSVVLEKTNYCNNSLNLQNIILIPEEDFYDTESLQNVIVNYITEPKEILKVNFNELEELYALSTDGIKEVISATCRYDGVVDGLVAWFKLHLDEDIIIDSSQGKSCWQFAVFSSCPHNVKKGDRMSIKAEFLSGKLKCSYTLIDTQFNIHSAHIYQMPRDIITFLNDSDYIKSLIDIAKSKKKDLIKTVFDTSPFPIYGLTLLKENRHCETLYFQTDNAALRHCIDHVMAANCIEKNISYVCNFNEVLSTLDNIFVHNFDTKGELLDFGQQSYQEMYSCLLSPCGTLLPDKIHLVGQLVFSEELAKMVSVKDENVQQYKNSLKHKRFNTYESDDSSEEDINNKVEQCESQLVNQNIKIAEYINKFKINQIFDLNSSLYKCTTVSEPKILTEMDGSEIKEEKIHFGKIDIGKSKVAPNALILWYKIVVSLDQVHESIRRDSFMNHSAIVFEEELRNKALKNEEISFRVLQMCDMVKIIVE